MASIHFICKEDDHLHRVTADGGYDSGNWFVTAADADALIGGMIFLHRTKADRSYFGGKIKSARPITNESGSPCFVFRFTPSQEGKNAPWRGANHTRAWTSGVIGDDN